MDAGDADTMGDFFNFADFDGENAAAYQSPTMPTPAESPLQLDVKAESSTASGLLTVETPIGTTALRSTESTFTGPSYQYDLYKQQTPIVPGAIATTLALNENNAYMRNAWLDQAAQFGFDDLLDKSDDMFDFNSPLVSDQSDVNLGSPIPGTGFPLGQTVDPSSIEPAGLPSPPVFLGVTSNIGRLRPGMHQKMYEQAAMAKAQQQQQQQAQRAQRAHFQQQQQQQHQQQQHQQQQQQQQQQPQQQPQKAKPMQSDEQIRNETISQLLSDMRCKVETPAPVPTMSQAAQRAKKEEAEMDEDERLLASEEGKKLSSQQRRQLRNKVSARNFRHRRKEFIQNLEAENHQHRTEIALLRAQNKALLVENQRLSDLARMLLSSPSFDGFLKELSANPQMAMGSSQPQAQPQQPPQMHQQPHRLSAPKDANPYAAQQRLQHPQMGLPMVPEGWAR